MTGNTTVGNTSPAGRTVVVTGTSTDVGKTVVTAALAVAARRAGATVAVCKPAQTGVLPGEPGDLAVVARLAGELATAECARFPEPLAPETAAARAGRPQLRRPQVAAAITDLSAAHDLTLVEGAGGVLVRLAPDVTIIDIAIDVKADAIVVVPAGLGALNHAELTVAALRAKGIDPVGLVIGSWPAEPDLAMACNRSDLPRLTGVPVIGEIPAGAGALAPADFRRAAPTWFDESLTDILGLTSPHGTLSEHLSPSQPQQGAHT
ncbi:MAG: dethiobiotin synthase [Gordonia sp. (in: high G+C Gram-positive bacteria)]